MIRPKSRLRALTVLTAASIALASSPAADAAHTGRAAAPARPSPASAPSVPSDPSEPSEPHAEHAVGDEIHLGDDLVLPEGVPETTTARMLGGPGYNTFPGGFRVGAQYSLRLVQSPGIGEYRPFALQAVRKLRGVLGPYFRYDDDIVSAPNRPRNFPSKAFELRIIVSERSPCDESSSNWIGCAGPTKYDVIAGQEVFKAGRVWLKPALAQYPDSVKTQVLLHELGHTMMLDHFNERYDGNYQIMRAVADGNTTSYRSGDKNGLRATRGRPPANDRKENAAYISLGDPVKNATTWFARADSRDPELRRAFPLSSERSVWYRFRAGERTVGRHLVLETRNDGRADFDTIMGHRFGNEFQHVDNDSGEGKQSRINFRPLDTSTVHFFVVDGLNGKRGTAQVRLRFAN